MVFPDKKINRRNIVIGGAVIAGAVSTPLFARSAILDPENATDRLRAMVRLRGAEKGPFWLLLEGKVHGRTPATVVQPLFGFTSLLRIQYKRISGELFEFKQRESAHYTSLNTGDPIGAFYNPYKEENNYAVGYVSPTFTYQFGLNGTSSIANPQHRGELTHQLVRDGSWMKTSEKRHLSYPSSIDLELFPEASSSATRHSIDIATYRANAKDVLDPSREFVDSAIDFFADTEWPYWMFMGDRPGFAIWIGHGAKIRNTDDLPTTVKRRVASVHPGFLEDAWGLDGAAYRTAPQMLKLRKAGVI